MLDPAQGTDAFLALGAAAATAGAAAAGAGVKAATGAGAAKAATGVGAGAAAKAATGTGAGAAKTAGQTAAAAAAAAGAAGATATAGTPDALSVADLLKQLQDVQAAVRTLPAVVLKDPAVKSALASLQAIASSIQGEETKAMKSLESIPAVKQLQAELTVLAKALDGYKQAATAKLSVEALVKQLPAPLQTVEKLMESAAKDFAAFITIISRDGDKDLFNGYPFNPQALMVRTPCAISAATNACACCVRFTPGSPNPHEALTLLVLCSCVMMDVCASAAVVHVVSCLLLRGLQGRSDAIPRRRLRPQGR
jgi:hypothetical protein